MNDVMKVLVHDLGFMPIGDYYETYRVSKALSFERPINAEFNDGAYNEVILSKSIDGWSIDSRQVDPGMDEKLSFPLTFSEIKAFEDFVVEFEKAF